MSKNTRPKIINWHQRIVIALVALTFFMSGMVSEQVFERLPHLEDEVAYLYQAKIFAGGNLVADSPQPTSAYWQPFVLDSSETGKRFGKYTPGWSALLSIGVILGYHQIVNMLVSALTIALIYRLGREIFNPDVGVVSAILVVFSPAALLLNGTLMSHTTGLFFATLFIYAYWRLEKHNRSYVWGLIAGLSLGILAATRPLTTLGIGLPFIAWSVVRLVMTVFEPKPITQFIKILTPLLILSTATLTLASSIPLFSYVATGDATQNLYELVWDYDRIGFGECCGRNQHRLSKAINHTRFDLSLTAADLFGWQFEPVTDEMISHLQQESDSYEGKGYSFYLVPLGIILGLGLLNIKRNKWQKLLIILWSVIAFAWVWFPANLTHQVFGFGRVTDIFGINPTIVEDFAFSWLWVGIALFWLFVPLLIWYRQRETPSMPYTWLLWSVVGSVVIVQMLYWIGSQRYSTRYYYEALSSAAILTAIPIATLSRLGYRWFASERVKWWRMAVYGSSLILCLFTLYNYTTPRLMALYRFNDISPELIQEVKSARTDDRPILAIVNGVNSGDYRVRWRSYAPLMVVTSPYLDSEIVAARASNADARDALIANFPERQVIDVYAVGNEASLEPIIP